MEYFSGETKALSTKAYGAALGASQAAKDHGKASKNAKAHGKAFHDPLHRDYRRKSQEAPGYEAGMMR